MMGDALILNLLFSDEWRAATKEFTSNAKWRLILDNAPIGAKIRLMLNFWVSCNNQKETFDRSLYLYARKEIEKSLTEVDLNYLIPTADKEALKNHYIALKEKLLIQPEKQENMSPSLRAIRYIQCDENDQECMSLEVNLFSKSLEVLIDEEDTYVAGVNHTSPDGKITMSKEEFDNLKKAVVACNFAGWNRFGPDFECDESEDDDRKWQLTLWSSDYPTAVIEGHGHCYAEWNQFLDVADICTKILKVPGFLHLPGMTKRVMSRKQDMRIKFHNAFTCVQPKQGFVYRQGEYTLVPLQSENMAATEICPPKITWPFSVKDNKVNLDYVLPLSANGFAVFNHGSIFFVGLFANRAIASNVLKDLCVPEIRTANRQLDDHEVSTQIAMVLGGCKLFNCDDDRPLYAYMEHQKGVYFGETEMDERGRLKFAYVICNGQKFTPAFSQAIGGESVYVSSFSLDMDEGPIPVSLNNAISESSIDEYWGRVMECHCVQETDSSLPESNSLDPLTVSSVLRFTYESGNRVDVGGLHINALFYGRVDVHGRQKGIVTNPVVVALLARAAAECRTFTKGRIELIEKADACRTLRKLNVPPYPVHTRDGIESYWLDRWKKEGLLVLLINGVWAIESAIAQEYEWVKVIKYQDGVKTYYPFGLTMVEGCNGKIVKAEDYDTGNVVAMADPVESIFNACMVGDLGLFSGVDMNLNDEMIKILKKTDHVPTKEEWDKHFHVDYPF